MHLDETNLSESLSLEDLKWHQVAGNIRPGYSNKERERQTNP
jgi:hypothetical protein